MKKTTVLFSMILLAFVISLCGQANAIDGNDLVEYMRELEKLQADNYDTIAIKAGYYKGYVDGIAETCPNVCPKGGMITRVKIRAIVTKYLKENPERWHEDAATLVVEALQKAFPCPEE